MMIYKEYGKTGIKLSAVGFGGMRFDTKKSIEENADLVRYASSKGINYFDTAPNYCEDKSEDIFGLAFKNMPNEFYVSTKGMPTKLDTKQKAKDAVKRSLDRLGVDKINFYHIWCIRNMSHYELAMKPGGQYEGLLECKEEGLIEHIVLSSHQNGDEVKRIVEDGKVEGILLGVNILNFPYRWDGIEAAYKNGCGIVAMNPLGGGIIPKYKKEFSFLADEKNSSVENALRFVISCPQITTAIVGFTTKEHIDTACNVAKRAELFTNKDIEKIKKHISLHMNELCTGCGYCKGCPQGINIPGFMQVYNERKIFNKSDRKMKNILESNYGWGLLVGQKGFASKCIECGLCEEACTQHLPIIERLKEISRWTKD